MPHTKSQGQTKPRGATTKRRQGTRRIQTGAAVRSAERGKIKELPMRGPNVVPKSARSQAERAYGGDTSRRMDVARGKRLRSQEADARVGRGLPNMADSLKQSARSGGRQPRKVAASSGKPRSKLGRKPVR
jgi:hypothetical protein